jgi:hypothetical protein
VLTRRLPDAIRQEARRLRLERRAALIGAGVEVGPRNKNRSVRTLYRGEAYDSLGEAEYAAKLDMLVKAGAVVDWERPARMAIDDRCLTCGATARLPCRSKTGSELAGFHRPRMTYKPDFYVIPKYPEPSYYVDFKGRILRGWNRTVTQWRKNIPFELRVAFADGTEKVVATGNECLA